MTAPDESAPSTQTNLVAVRVALLDQIASAQTPKTGGELNQRLSGSLKELKLADANRYRAELVADGLLRTEKHGRRVTFDLTDAGRAFLDSHQADLPPLTPRGFRPPSNDDVRRFRAAYLLLQILAAEPDRLRRTDGNKFDKQGRDALELNAATADFLRADFVKRGLIDEQGTGGGRTFALTDDGRAELGSVDFNPDAKFQLSGRTLNALLELGRGVGKQFAPPADVPAPFSESTPEQVEAAISAAFDELLREEFAVSGMVPIHRVRAAVRAGLGASAGRHDVFDPAVLRLWRGGQIRVFPITVLSEATVDQLQDSIPGVGETLFFLEAAREAVAG